MSFKAALDLRRQEDLDEDEGSYVYVSKETSRKHKFDPIMNLCVLCLTHKASNNVPLCPGLLDPTIKFNVG